MKKGIIKLQISDVWEIINKPHRMFFDIKKQVQELPVGEYEYLDFNMETKEEIIKRLNMYAEGEIIKLLSDKKE